ncbi:hypothetical protein CLHUN_12960 [Ruminiclostridium hungatei]|uniref:Uncharacterized protein n=1 Tax=Ruminiclostridium hungatei TaxID=48256 RepID=A0A1V4SML3_RUMHU|nr:hypothetical protein [Ruminiclostridium hungatei]OPX45064.1 hypothetical protein CLHUN_12960 [Ruminiclostridium hungatei]
MTSEEAWKKIIDKLSIDPDDYKSVPQINRIPVWFSASTDKEFIFINSAKMESPSSKITTPRKIVFSDFDQVYAVYASWADGEKGARSEVRKISSNTAYIFALIKALLQS